MIPHLKIPIFRMHGKILQGRCPNELPRGKPSSTFIVLRILKNSSNTQALASQVCHAAGLRAGYQNLSVSTSTLNLKNLIALLYQFLDISYYTHFLDSLHNWLLFFHFHVPLLLQHKILLTKILLPTISSLHLDTC